MYQYNKGEDTNFPKIILQYNVEKFRFFHNLFFSYTSSILL